MVSDPRDEATEKKILKEMKRAHTIIRELKKSSYKVAELICQLKTTGIEYTKVTDIKAQLREEFKTAMRQGNVSERVVNHLAKLSVRSTVDDLVIVKMKRGKSIVILFLCTTVKAHCELGRMVTSGFMRAIFTKIFSSQAPTATTVVVYVRADEFYNRLSVLSSAQGLFFDGQLLILKPKIISNVMLKLSGNWLAFVLDTSPFRPVMTNLTLIVSKP